MRARIPRERRGETRSALPWPRPTIRLRLTVTYGLVFLVTGAVLLTIGYLLVRSNLKGPHPLHTFLGNADFGRDAVERRATSSSAAR